MKILIYVLNERVVLFRYNINGYDLIKLKKYQK